MTRLVFGVLGLVVVFAGVIQDRTALVLVGMVLCIGAALSGGKS